jgi:hypothetical protein
MVSANELWSASQGAIPVPKRARLDAERILEVYNVWFTEERCVKQELRRTLEGLFSM